MARIEDSKKAQEVLLFIETARINVKKITEEALVKPTSKEAIKSKIEAQIKACSEFLKAQGPIYQELAKSAYNGLKKLSNECLKQIDAFFAVNQSNDLVKALALAYKKQETDSTKKTSKTFVIGDGELNLEEDMSVKFKETSGEYGYDQMIIDDYQERVKEAIKNISNLTLTEKTYREVNGRKVGAPVFLSIRNKAEMTVRYEAMKEELKELCDAGEQYVIVSQHKDASKRCSPLQGLLYKLDVDPSQDVKCVLSSKELGTRRPKQIGTVDGNPYYSLKEAMSYGLFSYNCRHRFIKYIPGSKVTPQYKYDEKAAEQKREIDKNMREMERQIRMLKERQMLSLDPKERALFYKSSKMLQKRYIKYAQAKGRVVNLWRCRISLSEREYNKQIYRTNGYMPLISPKVSEKSLEKMILEEYKNDNILECDAPDFDQLKENMETTLTQEEAEEAIKSIQRWTANDDGDDSCKAINSALYSNGVEPGSIQEKSVENMDLAINNSGYKTEKGQILYRSDYHDLRSMLGENYLKLENGAIEIGNSIYENKGFISCTNDLQSAINYARDKFESRFSVSQVFPMVIFRITLDSDIPFIPCEGITATQGDNEQLFSQGKEFLLKKIAKFTKSYIIIDVDMKK